MSQSIFSREVDPFKQGAGVFVGVVGITLLFKIFNLLGVFEFQAYLPWSMAASGLLFFAIMNSVLSLSYTDQNKYWLRSIIAYAGLMLASGLLSYLLSGLAIGEAKSFKWLFKLFTIGYIVFLTIVRLMRKIVQIAQKEDKRLRGEE